MSDDKNKGLMPEDGGNASPTEMDFDSFLGTDSSAAESEEEARAVEKSIAEEIQGLYAELRSNPDSSDKPEQPTPFAPADDSAPTEASLSEPEVFFTPEPPKVTVASEPEPVAAPESDDFSATLAGALSELDGLLDDIYSDTPVASEPKKPPVMQDVSSTSANDDAVATKAFGVVSPDELNALTPTAAKKPVSDALPQNESYFLGRVPATASDDVEPKPFAAPSKAASKPQRPSARPMQDEKKQKKTSSVFPAKGDSTGEIIRKIVLMVSIVTIVVSSGILVNSYFIEPYRFNVQADKAVDDLLSVDDSGNIHAEDMSAVSASNPNVVYPEGLLQKYYKLYAANNDLAGWVNIPALQINLPLVQGEDNKYYLKRDVYGKRTKYGVPFFDYRNSMRVLNRNTIVYGHNMEYDDLIFGMLENYRSIDGFKSAPVIECNTIYNDYSWLVYAVFVTNGAKKDDNGYALNYNFTELDNFTFLEYIKQVDQRKLYTTGVDILSTDRILTLSTCCYDFNGARLVVIARLLREGESLHVSTANAVVNPNPRYPQAWYDAQNKSNPYANAEKWVAYSDN